ncbi:hypothetical protein SGRA_2029 [Saprospira grandis str. Lewin]|uniref:Uncharacterized protein n=1 Tax=Saprospira grandis (strain Lewin) TaxID=984262 RepID=H6L2C2_SAPGL|nr:hypothetical protein SGRA_2029 [Saprospira grandis str. Lewin]
MYKFPSFVFERNSSFPQNSFPQKLINMFHVEQFVENCKKGMWKTSK